MIFKEKQDVHRRTFCKTARKTMIRRGTERLQREPSDGGIFLFVALVCLS